MAELFSTLFVKNILNKSKFIKKIQDCSFYEINDIINSLSNKEVFIIMDGVNDFIEQQGFYDYVNHFIAGAVLILGIETMMSLFAFSPIKEAYALIHLIPKPNSFNDFLWNSCVISLFGLTCFFTGILIQELYNVIYEKNFEKKSCHETNLFSKIKQLIYMICNKLRLRRLFFKVNNYSYINTIFTKNGPITNKNKRIRYKELAQQLVAKNLSNKYGKIPQKIFLDNNPKLVSYFFAYCIYYIQVCDKNKKTEKLRDIEGLSKSLSLTLSILSLVSVITTILLSIMEWQGIKTIWKLKAAYGTTGIVFAFISIIVCVICSIAFDYRTERTLINRIRMTLAIYEAEMDREK